MKKDSWSTNICINDSIRLYQAFSEKQNLSFGSCSIILVGDFGQLPPVLGEPIYSQITWYDTFSNDGIKAYK